MKTAVVKRREEEANLKLQKSSRVGSLFGRSGKDMSGTSSVRKITNGPELLRQSFLEAARNVSGSKRSLSSPLDQMLMAVVSDAFAQRTLEVVHSTTLSAVHSL